MEELAVYIARPLLFAGRVALEVAFHTLPDALLFWCERKGERAGQFCKWGFVILLLALVLILGITMTGCATRHPDCERADAFGHCQQWRGQPQVCEKTDVLGFCPPVR